MMSKVILALTIALLAVVASELLSQPGERQDWYCDNGGEPYCDCPEGWEGPHCGIPKNYCNTSVLYKDHMVSYPLCGIHGICHYDTVSGSSCNCTDPGWYGKFCDKYDPKEVHISERCIAYEPNTTQKLETHYRCDLNHERCIPDDIDCMFNTATGTDSNGNAYCADSRKSPCDGLCKCKNPIGWCIPLEIYQSTVKVLSLTQPKDSQPVS